MTDATAAVFRAAYTGRSKTSPRVIAPGLIPKMKMQSSHGSWAQALETKEDGPTSAIPPHEIFVQTPRGAAVVSSRDAELSQRLRTLLFLINGRRRMFEYRDLLPRYRNIDDTFDMLARKGYIERLSGNRQP